MNLSAFQLFGIVVGAFFCYSSYLQYRKGLFDKTELLTWLTVWGGLILVSLISALHYPLTTTVVLSYNILDMVSVLSITLLAAISFSLYTKIKIQEKKIKRIVRKIALDDD